MVDQYQDTISHMFDQAGKTLLCAVKAEGYTYVSNQGRDHCHYGW